MGRLRVLRPTLATFDSSIARVPSKQVDPYYVSPEWRALRIACLCRDRYKCTAPGCTNTATVADHIVSRKAGGPDTLDNLRSLCRSCDARIREDASGRRKAGGKL
jgi:5-methylcytosine-specific restriction enzyme A